MWATARGHLFLGLFVRRFFDARCRTLRSTSVVEDFGQFGRAFRETDLAEADLGTIVHNLISGEYRNPLRVIAFNTVEEWSRDVSEEIAYDVLDRAYDADTTLSVGAKRFIERHVTPDAKRPPGAVGTARTTRGGPQEGVKPGSTSRAGASILARDRRHDTSARHQG
jgi:hypothetical protein